MFGQSLTGNSQEQQEKMNHMIRIPQGHEDLVFQTIQHMTKVIDVALSHKGERLTANDSGQDWDVSEYIKTMGILKKNRIKIISELAQKLKECWLESSNQIDNEIKLDDNFEIFREDETILAIKLEIYAVTQRVRDKNINDLSSLREKISQLLNVNISSFEKCPFDVGHLCNVYFNALNTVNININQKLMALRLFETEIARRLSNVYARLLDNIDVKIEAQQNLLTEEFGDDWLYSEQEHEDVYVQSHGQSALLIERERLSIETNRIVKDILSGQKNYDVSELRSLIIKKIKGFEDVSVVFDVYCESALEYIESTFYVLLKSHSEPESKMMLLKVQLIFLKLAMGYDGFVESKAHSAKQLLNLIVKMIKPSSKINKLTLARLIHIGLDKLLSVNDLNEDACTIILRQLAQKYSHLIRKSRGIIAAAPSPLQKQIRAILNSSLPEASPKLLQYVVHKLWFKALYITASAEGQDSAEWHRQIEKMNTLIWTMQPTTENCDLLSLRLPAVMESVQRNMQLMPWTENQQSALLNQLKQFFSVKLNKKNGNVNSDSKIIRFRQRKESKSKLLKPNSVF